MSRAEQRRHGVTTTEAVTADTAQAPRAGKRIFPTIASAAMQTLQRMMSLMMDAGSRTDRALPMTRKKSTQLEKSIPNRGDSLAAEDTGQKRGEVKQNAGAEEYVPGRCQDKTAPRITSTRTRPRRAPVAEKNRTPKCGPQKNWSRKNSVRKPESTGC